MRTQTRSLSHRDRTYTHRERERERREIEIPSRASVVGELRGVAMCAPMSMRMHWICVRRLSRDPPIRRENWLNFPQRSTFWRRSSRPFFASLQCSTATLIESAHKYPITASIVRDWSDIITLHVALILSRRVFRWLPCLLVPNTGVQLVNSAERFEYLVILGFALSSK
jgi:hypothetical protein